MEGKVRGETVSPSDRLCELRVEMDGQHGLSNASAAGNTFVSPSGAYSNGFAPSNDAPSHPPKKPLHSHPVQSLPFPHQPLAGLITVKLPTARLEAFRDDQNTTRNS
jgi:hypothetical protein